MERASSLSGGSAWFRILVLGFWMVLGSVAQIPPGAALRPIRVGVNNDYPPYEFVDQEGKVQGYDVDLIRAAGRVMGMQIEILPGPWSEIRQQFQSGRLEVLPGLLKSEDRARWAEFTQAHLVVHYSLFSRRDSPEAKGLEDLRGKQILVEKGSQMDEQLTALGFAAEAVRVVSEPEALRQLAAGRGDAALVPHLEGMLQARDSRLSNIRPVGSPLFSRELCIAVKKGDPELRSRFDSGLAILHRTGEYQQIYKKWFGDANRERFGMVALLKSSLWVLIPVALCILAILIWNGALRRQVYRSTLQLREANRALREQENMLNAVIDSLPLMLFVKDPRRDFCFTVWNAKTEELLGVPREAMLGKTDYELLPAEEVPPFRAADQAVLDSGQTLDIPEETVLSPVKGPVQLHTIKVPVFDEDGRPRFLLGISEDITPLKRMQADLKRSQESLAQAQRIAQMGSWEWEPDPDQMRWSEELGNILGEDPATASMEVFLQHIHPDDRRSFQDLVFRVKDQQQAAILNHRLRPATGATRLVQSRIDVRRDATGKVLSLLGTCQDLTESRLAEESLRQTQKLEALGVLAGGMAHDFNNLLTAILGNLNLAQLKLPGDNPVQGYLERIESTVLKASQLARQILAYSGRGSFVIKPLDLNQLLLEMSHLLEVTLPKKVTLALDLDPSLPRLEGDETQLQQVVLNLLTNAAEAIGDAEGAIQLVTRRTDLNTEDRNMGFKDQDLGAGPFVELRVQDSGCGMPPEIQARIFEPFFTTKFSGRGLGLSAMKGILEGHHAGIFVASDPPHGTLFRILFPALPDTPGTVVPFPAPPIQRALAGRILVVDDEPVVRAAAAEMLQEMGYEPVQAGDGLEAVEIMRSQGQDIGLVLLDLTMPRMDGREALKEIMKINPGTKVVLCSGFNEQEALTGPDAASVAAFLSKPYRMRDLRTLLEGLEERT